MRHFLSQGHSVWARTASLSISTQSHIFHDFFFLHVKMVEYPPEMHKSRRNFHRRDRGLTPGGPWLENFGLGDALRSFWLSKRLILIEINNKNKPNRTLKNDLSKYLKVG